MLKINSVSRISLDKALREQFGRLKSGIVLDVGSKLSPYKNIIPYTRYMRLDIDKNSSPDICCDIHSIKWKSGYFDTVIATEVLEHLYDPQTAVNEIFRILKKNGVCIASTRFIYRYHPDPHDYYRFTWDSLRHIFKKFSRVEIIPHGNRVQALWQIFNPGFFIFNLLNPLFARINFADREYPCGFVVYAQK